VLCTVRNAAGNKLSSSLLFCSKLGFSRLLDSLYGRFDGVHVFRYNSTESELIWMKSGALLSPLLSIGGWPWQILNSGTWDGAPNKEVAGGL